MKKVALYCRVSSSDQNTETQLMALRDYCQRMGYTDLEEYVDDGFSGKDQNRPAFERLLGDIRARRVDCLICFKLDRIGRSLKHLLNLFEEFKALGIEFVSITQNINTATPEGQMFWQLLGVFSEYERGLIIARTKSGLDRARRQGKKLGRPFGSKDQKQRRRSGYLARWKRE